MKVLVACEESQRVCMAFREKGHEAYSCDIQECSGGHPEWHIKGDVLPLLDGMCTFRTMDGASHLFTGIWDMLIAHPPCTFLSNAGAARLYKRIDGKSYCELSRLQKGLEAKEFFMKFFTANVDKIVIENPIPSGVFGLPAYDQIIQPYEFGHEYSKKTCLWLKNVPKLKPTKIIEPKCSWVSGGTKKPMDNQEKIKALNSETRKREAKHSLA